MKLTGVAILVSRDTKVLQAAPAAYPYRSGTRKDGFMCKSVACWGICLLVMGSITIAWCAEAADTSSLEGTWIADALESDGEKAPEDVVKNMRFRFAGDKLFVRGNFGDDREEVCSFALDDTKTPKHLDFTPPKEKKPVLAIYERNGKTLKMCIRHGNSDKGRPTEFKTTPGSRSVLIVFSLREK